MTSKPHSRTFWSMVAVIRERCPGLVPYRIRRPDYVPGNALGDCRPVYRRGSKELVAFEIRVCARLNEDHAIDILVHEVAHALAWNPGGPDGLVDDHDDAWGIAYAFVYRETL